MSPAICWALSRFSGYVVCALMLATVAACHQGSRASRRAPEMVNVGYGERSREQVGGAVPSLVFSDSTIVKARRVEELLDRLPGVHVRRTASGGYSVRIRGTSTFISNSEPLYVIDGMAVQVTPGLGLDWLSPVDIARIDVLRDPAETSMYGVRGANGVILIRTKLR